MAKTKAAHATGGPLVILYSKDLDATLKAVGKAGGKISKKPFEFPGGRRFHFADPSASNSGYMLVDAGSFYDRHLKKWIADVQKRSTASSK